MKKAFILLLVLFILLPLSACSELQIHFLDVGQGDCTIVLCDGESMVIDGGPRASASTVYNYVKKTLKLQHIDYVISTHPHLDHVYGLSSVLNAAPVDLLLSPSWGTEMGVPCFSAYFSMYSKALESHFRTGDKSRSTGAAFNTEDKPYT